MQQRTNIENNSIGYLLPRWSCSPRIQQEKPKIQTCPSLEILNSGLQLVLTLMPNSGNVRFDKIDWENFK